MAETSKQREAKKTFFEVKAPLTSAPLTLYAASAQELHGRVVRLDLTRILRGKSTELRLRVHAEGNELHAEPEALELAGSYLRRVVRKGSDYVEDSFEAECKDATIVIKPFLVTRKKVPRTLRHALRRAARDFLLGHITVRNAKELFSELLANKIQRELAQKLKKLYPLTVCEIRVFAVKGKKEEKK